MHVIQPGLNPVDHFVSEYAYGRMGWLVRLSHLLAGSWPSPTRADGSVLGATQPRVAAVTVVVAVRECSGQSDQSPRSAVQILGGTRHPPGRRYSSSHEALSGRWDRTKLKE
jgi:hypothetical protein